MDGTNSQTVKFQSFRRMRTLMLWVKVVVPEMAMLPRADEGGLFEKFLAGPNLDIQHVFPRGENTDELLVIRTRGMVSHIEV